MIQEIIDFIMSNPYQDRKITQIDLIEDKFNVYLDGKLSYIFNSENIEDYQDLRENIDLRERFLK